MVDVLAWLQTWSAVIGAIGSLLLSGLLALLYWKQQGLLTRELNREVRKNHSETLRKRIQAWHGAIDQLESSQSETPYTNLPDVRRNDVVPAGELGLEDEYTEFRVVPEEIEDDRYLQDLLENHAPRLRELKEKIEDQYEQFDGERESFLEKYSGEEIDEDEYSAEPLDRFSEWVFEQAVPIHREEKDHSDQKAVVKDHFSQMNPKPNSEFHYSPDPGSRDIATYHVENKAGKTAKLEDEDEERIKEIHLEAIEDIDDTGVYEHTAEATRILDEMEETIEELQWALVEYEGHPIYHGDCKYIDEASVKAPRIRDRILSIFS